MINVEEIRRDFPMLKQTMQGKPLVYLDNAATTFKPQAVIDAVCNYYTNFNANCHRGDYDLSHDVDVAYEGVRTKVGKFINCLDKEVVFTSGASESLNIVANGLGQWLEEGDEILLNEKFAHCRGKRGLKNEHSAVGVTAKVDPSVIHLNVDVGVVLDRKRFRD